MRKWITAALVFMPLVLSAGATPVQRFIPWSPLTEEEIARQKARFAAVLSAQQADEMLRDPFKYHRYRERDIVAVYPELRGSKKLSSCSNSIMTGATRIVFVSHIDDHEVTLKTLSCAGTKGGILCNGVKTTKNFFLQSFREPIELEGVPTDTAQVIAETYQARRVDNLPDWFEGHFPELNYIRALPDGRYTLIFGDYFCAGCSFRYDARLDVSTGQPRLVVLGNADGGCF